MFAQIADRVVLKPSTHPIKSVSSVRHSFEFDGGVLEYWADRVQPSDTEPDTGKLLLIKFPGTGGRAERASTHPAECWGGDTLTWTINPMGYGGSTGPATLQKYPDMVRAIARHAATEAPDREVIVTGNSLGGVSALAFAANFSVKGVLIRNPPPLHQLIGMRWKYTLPTLGLNKLIAAAIPEYLDCLTNAQACTCPCWLVSCQNDRVVPPVYQYKIWEKLAGRKSRFDIPDAGHGDPIPDKLVSKYFDWVRQFGEIL